MKSLLIIFLFLLSGCSFFDSDKATPFYITHVFEVNRETVYEMWINPRSFSKWLGPNNAVMSFMEIDISEGGSSLWSVTTPDGEVRYGRLNYKKLLAPHTIVYSQYFTDKEGKFIKAPFSPTYPNELLTTVTLTEDEPNRTLVSVKWEVYGSSSRIERRTFNEMKPQMNQDWEESFERLESLLEARKIQPAK